VVVLAKLVSQSGQRPPIAQLAGELSMSSSQIHLSLKRLELARLISSEDRRPLLRAVEEFFIHGVKYAFPAQRGGITRGMPTAHAAPPLNQQIAGGADPPPVWPSPEGHVRGSSFEPLHKMVPATAAKDPALYELLALIDALRDGRARERQLAENALADLLRQSLHG
jgi:hypothetical protein